MTRSSAKEASHAEGVHLQHDVWQAALLLVGLFGNDAAAYAAKKKNRRLAVGDVVGAETWSHIAWQIEMILQDH